MMKKNSFSIARMPEYCCCFSIFVVNWFSRNIVLIFIHTLPFYLLLKQITTQVRSSLRFAYTDLEHFCYKYNASLETTLLDYCLVDSETSDNYWCYIVDTVGQPVQIAMSVQPCSTLAPVPVLSAASAAACRRSQCRIIRHRCFSVDEWCHCRVTITTSHWKTPIVLSPVLDPWPAQQRPPAVQAAFWWAGVVGQQWHVWWRSVSWRLCI